MNNIELCQRDEVEAVRLRYGHETASHAFPSLYGWQWDMGLSILMESDMFAVKCRFKGDNAWFFPCGEEEAKKRFISGHLEEPDFKLCYIRPEDMAFIEKYFNGRFHLRETPGDHEYLYDREEQILLAGGRFYSLRRNRAKLLREHQVEVRTLGPEELKSAMKIAGEWKHRSHPEGEGGLMDRHAVNALLENVEELNIMAVLVYVDGKETALCGGYGLCETVFDLSFAKQRENMPGLAPYSRAELFRVLPERYTCINAEEDLGLEGLRTLKQNMRPIGMNRMFEGEVKGNEA